MEDIRIIGGRRGGGPDTLITVFKVRLVSFAESTAFVLILQIAMAFSAAAAPLLLTPSPPLQRATGVLSGRVIRARLQA